MDVKELTWHDSYSVRIAEVDEQHKTLLELLNQLLATIRERREKSVCRAALDQLADYTATHFELEERLMQAAAYAGFDIHKAQHDDLMMQIKTLQKKLDSGAGSINFELLHFLQFWLIGHITESDKRFGTYLETGDQSAVYATWSNEVKTTLQKKRWWPF